MKFIKYVHHEVEVWVREDLKGKHREHCLCWKCAKFFPDDRERNCLIASLNFSMDKAFNITTPVFECPDFLETKSKNEMNTSSC
jgi:hypothetical protein